MAPLPQWMTSAMQGLAFWIGHRNTRYPHYHLVEGALVGEVANLIHGNLKSGDCLHCEYPYSRFVTNQEESGARVDLAVVHGVSPKEAKTKSLTRASVTAIEVKRFGAGSSQIKKDLERLAVLKMRNPRIRTLMLLVSERARPTKFVTKNGIAVHSKPFELKGQAVYKVRRVCKASASFGQKSNAHYVVCLEVFAPPVGSPTHGSQRTI